MSRDALPTTLAGFERYCSDCVASLAVSEEARGIARDLVAPPAGALGALATPALRVLGELSAGLLLPRIRVQYGLAWGPPRKAALRALATASRLAAPRLPPALRRPPAPLLPPGALAPRASLAASTRARARNGEPVPASASLAARACRR